MFINFRLNPFYAPEGDIGASAGTEEVADLGADEGADPFDSLSFSVGDEETEEETTDTEEESQEEETTKEVVEEENKGEAAKEKRTSKQDPAVDALHARARRAEENAARLERELNEHREKLNQETQKQAQAQLQSKLAEQWNDHVKMADQMREAGYDERVVAQFLEAQKKSLQAEEQNHVLENRLNQLEANMKLEKQEQAKQQKEREVNEGRELLVRDHQALKEKYGDLVYEAKTFDDVFQGMDPEMVDLVSKGVSMEKAFKIVNHEKILKHEKSLAEKRTTANFVDRSKKSVETDKTVKQPEDILTEGQKRFAKEFGVDPKEVAKRSNPNLFKKNKGVS